MIDPMENRLSRSGSVSKLLRVARGACWLVLLPAATTVGAADAQSAAKPASKNVPAAAQHHEPAPQVDLDKPLPKAKPLLLEDAAVELPAEASAVVEEKKPAEAELSKAAGVVLGQPVPEALPLQVVAEPTKPAAQSVDGEVVASGATGDKDAGKQLAGEVVQGATVEPVVETELAVPEAPEPKAEPFAVVAEAEVTPAPAKPFVILGAEVAPATSTRLAWSPSHSFEGIAVATPVLVVNGAKPGPVLCLTAAVHGDELNGIEIVRRVLYNLNARKLTGTVIGVPIVNLQGFRRGSRYLPDRRDLNRFFPGDPRGSSAARIAYSFFNEVIKHCDALVDLHTGSFYRTNLPQLRADLRDPEVMQLSQGFDGTVVLQSDGAPGTLRVAAVAAGIPAVTLEAGEPLRLQETEVNHGVKSVQALLGKMGMIKKTSFWGQPEPIYYQSAWVRADQGGILFSEVDLGERVKENELLGTVTDPITNVRTEILSPYKGRVLGMALNQVVMPGFAAFRIGILSSEDEVIDTTTEEESSSTLHTSQAEPEPEIAVPTVKPEKNYDDFEGLEDSE
jgi:hypothetical protein